MKVWRFVLLVLLLMAPLSGCLGEKPGTEETAEPSVTKAPSVTEESEVSATLSADELEGQFPDITATTEDEITIVEPDLEVDESVDLGSIL